MNITYENLLNAIIAREKGQSQFEPLKLLVAGDIYLFMFLSAI